MPALFDHEMALAAVDPASGLQKNGRSWWTVHYFDRMGRWNASCLRLTKEAAKKKAAAARRRARQKLRGEA